MESINNPGSAAALLSPALSCFRFGKVNLARGGEQLSGSASVHRRGTCRILRASIV
jgi:hypothetical protein